MVPELQPAKIRNSVPRKWTIVFLLFLFSSHLATTVFAADISGRVSNSAGVGIAGIYVDAYDAASGIFISGASTQADGSYTLSGLATGSYKLKFYGYETGYLSQWYNNKATQQLANVVTVTAGNITPGINATLSPGGSISGKVSNSAGVGIAGAFVDVYDAASGTYIYYASTQADGSYTLLGLATGRYNLEFYYWGETGYLSQWFNNKTSQELADAVAVTAGNTTSGINATLTPRGTITGKVSNSAGVGIAGVYVYAFDVASGTYISGAATQADGSYTLLGLPAGSYKLKFYGDKTGYISQWYHNKTSQELADAVTVTAGNTTPGINATLTPGGTIAGKVSNSAGVGIADVYVDAYDAASGLYINGAATQADGSYTLLGLATGSYKLEFYDYNTGYPSQWYNNKASQELADAVTVTAGNTTYGINATLDPGGTIAGKVSNAAGIGIADVYVDAYDAASGSYINGASTQVDGSYTLLSLPTGSYTLVFYDPYNTDYQSQWYNNKASQELADAVTVTAGNTTPGINATMVLDSGQPVIPDAPTITSVKAGNLAASIYISPGSDGGSPITGYTVTSSAGTTTPTLVLPIIVTGLVNGSTYTFTANAINNIGTSTASPASDPLKPGLVRNYGYEATGYQTLQAAYNANTPTSEFQIITGAQVGELVKSDSNTVAITGGYDDTFTYSEGPPSFLGTVKLKNGLTRFRNIKIKPAPE